jgi:hypothetical protein
MKKTMSANFGKLKLRYKDKPTDPEVDVVLELSSINFDINQTTIGPNTPFTTEMAFEVQVAEFAKKPKSGIIKIKAVEYDLNTLDGFGVFLQNEVFTSENSMSVEFPSFSDISQSSAEDGEIAHALIALQSPDTQAVSDALWSVHLKFHSVTKDGVDKDEVLYPQLTFATQGSAPVLYSGPVTPQFSQDALLNAFNDLLKSSYELLLIANDSSASSATNTIGKVADEVADSFATLSATIADKLSGTINARLQPSAGQITHDLALWVIIRKGTEDLAFDNYQNFMDEIFCGTPQTSLTASPKMSKKLSDLNRRRGLPFMGVDAYHSLKVATEAFVMVNCMTDGIFDDEVLADLNKNVPWSMATRIKNN